VHMIIISRILASSSAETLNISFKFYKLYMFPNNFHNEFY
jgi:hypothetical protein